MPSRPAHPCLAEWPRVLPFFPQNRCIIAGAGRGLSAQPTETESGAGEPPTEDRSMKWRNSRPFGTRHLCLFAVLLITGCGHYPPVVETAADVQRLPTSEKSIRARGLADDDIPSLARLRGLKYIDFSSGVAVEKAKITDKGLEQLAKLDLPNLEELDLGWCDNITDAGVAHVCKIRTLTMLLLMACTRITDSAIPELAKAKTLTYLDLRGGPGITDGGLQKLAAKHNWEHIELGGAPNITAKGVAQLQAALPRTRINKDDQQWSEHFARLGK